MGLSHKMLYLFLFLFSLISRAEILDVEKNPDNRIFQDPQYIQCVSWGMNHPLRKGFRVEGRESRPRFMDSLDEFCRCKKVVDHEELKRSHDQKMGYFFSGRSQYFSEIDICLQEKVDPREMEGLFGMLLYDQLVPLVSAFITDGKNQGIGMVVGREIAQSMDDCLQTELLMACKKVQSLYFTYKCLRRKSREPDFMEKAKQSCREIPDFQSELI